MRKIRSLLAVFLLSQFCLPLRAIENLKFEYITNKDGLSHNTVRRITQDSRGFMWFGTINGMNRYDGREILALLPQFGPSSLSVNSIKKMLEDNNGYIWIQSTYGLVDCYDTRSESFVEFKGEDKNDVFREIKLMSNGDVWMWGKKGGAVRVQHKDGKLVSKIYDGENLQTNCVNFIFEDSNGQIWLGTDKDLYLINEGNPQYVLTSDNNLYFLQANESGRYIYFFTSNHKVIIIDRDKKRYVKEVDLLPSDKTFSLGETVVLNHSEILITGKQGIYLFNTDKWATTSTKPLFNEQPPGSARVLFDNKGNPWLYNKSGYLWQYIKSENKFKPFHLIPPSILSLIDLERYDVWVDSRDIIWITTYGNGMFAIDPEDGDVKHITRNNSGLKTNYLLSVYEDKSGEIWVGTEYTGITKILLTSYQNEIFFPGPDKSNVEDKIVRSIFFDKAGDMWIGTKNGNLYVYDEDLKQLKNTFRLSRGIPYCMAEDDSGNKWIGTKGNGLVVYSEDKKKQDTYMYRSQDSMSLANNSIFSILIDSGRNAWIGTFGGGLQYAERKGDNIYFERQRKISADQKYIHCMLRDSSGKIWVGGKNGVMIFDPDKLRQHPDQYQNLHFDRNNPESLNQNEVKCLFEDSKKQMWIGTSGGGLNLAVRDSSGTGYQITHYTTEEGLVNNVIQSIEEDDNGNLWISTESGISKLDLGTKRIENYNFSELWESNLFCESASCKRKDGKLIFGSFNGMYIFDPSTFVNHFSDLPVLLTKLLVNGIPVKPGAPDSPLQTSITETESIRLKNGQNAFSIEFSSLNFRNEYSNRYTYILENYDKTWNPVTQFNVATYKNVPAGNYVFRVKGINSSGELADKETVLNILVVPPFWKSNKATALYLVVAMVAFFFIAKLVIKMNNLHNAVVVEKRLTEYRLRFFTNISHEFRTPLTIIRGSIENMNSMKALPAPLKEQVRILEKSSSRLMRLIDQLLEFRKLQNEKLELYAEATEAVGFFTEIYNMFKETARQKGIDFVFSADEDAKMVMIDRSKMDKIAYNLLSNAFKHTPQGGTIHFKLDFNKEDRFWQLTVADSGIGIPTNKRDMIFQRFNQVNYTTSGIGIGLNLTYEFVNMHHGRIEYADSEWGGASFIMSVPVTEVSAGTEEVTRVTPSFVPSIDTEEETPEQETNDALKDYKILIVEDDEEIRSFLTDQLKNTFHIFTAADGREGLEMAIQEQPNLVICDVMMPQMDGFEVTKRLKSDFNTSHIPIILLTAHSSMEHQVEGIEAGADAYIVKPFSLKYLMTRVVKLIEQREKLQHKFSQEPGIELTTISTTEKDKAFIEKINTIIYDNLDNPEFNVEFFAQAVGLGRTMLYKKVKGITGYSANEYVRVVRLKRAAELLKTTDLNVSEIAYKVGFSDPFYFSRCFKEQFSASPLQFRKN